MTDRWKIGLIVAAALLALPIYFSLRPASPKAPPHTDKKELVCIDAACGFRGEFAEAEAIESVQQHGMMHEQGVDLFHCPSCTRLSLYRAELAPLPFDEKVLPRR